MSQRRPPWISPLRTRQTSIDETTWQDMIDINLTERWPHALPKEAIRT